MLQILAEPNLLTMNGKEASFVAGGATTIFCTSRGKHMYTGNFSRQQACRIRSITSHGSSGVSTALSVVISVIILGTGLKSPPLKL